MRQVKKRVCLVSPGHLSTNPRLVKEARALEEAGYVVQIVHGYYLPWGVEQDRAIASPGWILIPVPFGKKLAPRVHHVRQKLIQALSLQACRIGMRTPLTASYAQAAVGRDLITAACSAPPADLYIGHYPTGLAAAARAAVRHNAPYAFDAEDFHIGDLPNTPENATSNAIIRGIEAAYLMSSSYISAASPLIARAYHETYRVPEPVPLLNVFPKSNAPSTPSAFGTAQPGPSIYWFSQTIGPGRGLETVVQALARAISKPHLYLRGTPAAGFKSEIDNLATDLGVRERIHFIEPAPPDEMERLGATYDLGIAAEIDNTINHSFALANKIFSYIISGIPCIATDILSHIYFENENTGLITLYKKDDYEDLSEKIDYFLLNRQILHSARLKTWTAGQTTLNWDTTKTKFLGLVEAAMAPRRLAGL